jgi:hypothetical protein
MAMTNVFTGSNGALMIMKDGTDAEQIDADSILGQKAYDMAEIGRVTDIEVHVQTNLEEFHEIGQRHARSLHPGNIHISGRIGRAYVNGALLYLLLGRGASPNKKNEPYVQPTLAMNVILQDAALSKNRAILNVYGMKFQDWSQAMPEDDFVMENVTFKALSINVQDEEDSKVVPLEFK